MATRLGTKEVVSSISNNNTAYELPSSSLPHLAPDRVQSAIAPSNASDKKRTYSSITGARDSNEACKQQKSQEQTTPHYLRHRFSFQVDYFGEAYEERLKETSYEQYEEWIKMPSLVKDDGLSHEAVQQESADLSFIPAAQESSPAPQQPKLQLTAAQNGWELSNPSHPPIADAEKAQESSPAPQLTTFRLTMTQNGWKVSNLSRPPATLLSDQFKERMREIPQIVQLIEKSKRANFTLIDQFTLIILLCTIESLTTEQIQEAMGNTLSYDDIKAHVTGLINLQSLVEQKEFDQTTGHYISKYSVLTQQPAQSVNKLPKKRHFNLSDDFKEKINNDYRIVELRDLCNTPSSTTRTRIDRTELIIRLCRIEPLTIEQIRDVLNKRITFQTLNIYLIELVQKNQLHKINCVDPDTKQSMTVYSVPMNQQQNTPSFIPAPELQTMFGNHNPNYQLNSESVSVYILNHCQNGYHSFEKIYEKMVDLPGMRHSKEQLAYLVSNLIISGHLKKTHMDTNTGSIEAYYITAK